MPHVLPDDLNAFTRRLFQALGVPADEAAVVADNLVGANLRGHDSHGVMRALQYADFVRQGLYRPGAPLEIISEGPAVLVCDGGWGFGQVQAHRLLDLLIPKARSLGLASGAGRDFGHIGRLGDYAERAADLGLILLATVNNCGSGQRVSPPGGLAPRLGTNPLCAAIPTDDGPVVLDFGTSVVAEGKVRVYHLSNRPVPDGWILDSHGQPTNDPSVLYSDPPGTILPIGGAQSYKGFGLALVLDMLSSGLSGGRACFDGAPPARGNNVLFVLFDPSHFAGTDRLLAEATGVARFVRDTPLAPGVPSITLPGDPERSTLEARSSSGIPLPDGHWERLSSLAAELSVTLPPIIPS